MGIVEFLILLAMNALLEFVAASHVEARISALEQKFVILVKRQYDMCSAKGLRS